MGLGKCGLCGSGRFESVFLGLMWVMALCRPSESSGLERVR